MTIKVVKTLDAGDLNRHDVHATIRIDKVGARVVFLARDDYYESGGVCYSGIDLTRDDVDRILVLLEDADDSC